MDFLITNLIDVHSIYRYCAILSGGLRLHYLGSRGGMCPDPRPGWQGYYADVAPMSPISVSWGRGIDDIGMPRDIGADVR